MAPADIYEIRRIIRARLADSIERKEWDESKAAAEIGVKRITIRRWVDGSRKDASIPSLDDARRAADALGVSLDYLTGQELTPAQTLASVAGRIERETETMRLRLDDLMADLTAARQALVAASGHEAQIDTALGRVGGHKAEKVAESIAIAREPAS